MYDVPYIFHESIKQGFLRSCGIHLGVCGSIAAFRSVDLLRWWLKNSLRVSVTLSDSAQRFITPLTFKALGANPVYTDMWQDEEIFGHLEPGQNADIMVIAPATAATLADIAHGNAHNMLSCQTLSFNPKKILLAPAMNPHMWENPAVQENIDILRKRGVNIIIPDTGGTACGDEGQGRLADLRHIWLTSLKLLAPQDMLGKKVMLTLGPTREQWDAVRYWSNPSTGTMGMMLALTAWLRGAEVHAICGPIAENIYYLPPEIKRYPVISANDMYEVATDLWANMDIGIFTAAVADYAPKPYGVEKFKKNSSENGLCVEFTPNIDILHTLGSQKKSFQKIIGFAAETLSDNDAMFEAVRGKLSRKNTDLLAGNNISAVGSGFGVSTNAMFVADKNGREEIWDTMPKLDVAWRLCSWIQEI